MNTKLAAGFLVAGALMLPLASYSADYDTDRSSPTKFDKDSATTTKSHRADSDTDRSSPTRFVKDSAITTKIKAELAEEKMSSLVHVRVDTDKMGQVSLSGTTETQAEADKAVTIARAVEGVTHVRSTITVRKD